MRFMLWRVERRGGGGRKKGGCRLSRDRPGARDDWRVVEERRHQHHTLLRRWPLLPRLCCSFPRPDLAARRRSCGAAAYSLGRAGLCSEVPTRRGDGDCSQWLGGFNVGAFFLGEGSKVNESRERLIF